MPKTTLEPLSSRTLHVVIDMQRLFAEDTVWHTPGLTPILPAVLRLSMARVFQTIFARFMVPDRAEAAAGRWRTYYERSPSVTGERLPPGMLDLVAPLAAVAQAGAVFEKMGYSIFSAPDFVARLGRDGIDTLVLTGVETDVCVLASLFDAVDRGYRVVVATDAVASSSMASHAAVLDLLLPRLASQVDLWTVDEVLDAWA